MICSYCGTSNRENAAFCANCGTPLKAPQTGEAAQVPKQVYPAIPGQAYGPPYQQAAYPPQAPYQQPYPGYGYPQHPPVKKKKTGLIIGIAAAVLLIAAAAVTLILLLGKDEAKHGNGGEDGGTAISTARSTANSTAQSTAYREEEIEDTGIRGKWVVVDREGWTKFDPGMVFYFGAEGILFFEGSEDAPDYIKEVVTYMNIAVWRYKVTEGELTLIEDLSGDKEEFIMRCELEGDTLTLYESSGVTYLKRYK